MSNKFVYERLGIVSKVIMSEQSSTIRISTGERMNEVYGPVDIDAAQARTLARQLNTLARRLDKRLEVK